VTVEATSVDIVLVQMELEDDDQNPVQRTAIVKTKARKPKPFKLILGKAHVNDDNDIAIPFQGQACKRGEMLDFAARVGVELKGELISEEIDVKAMQDCEEPQLIVHGGWVRRALSNRGLTEADDFDIVVTEACATDPNTCSQVGLAEGTHVLNLKKHERRRHLAAKPTDAELKVTDEMLMGRKPDIRAIQSGNADDRRRLSDTRKKIILHGCCSSRDTFPLAQLTDTIKHEDPQQADSHHQFAANLHWCLLDESLTSCGIIAHSQGGPAALTMCSKWCVLQRAACVVAFDEKINPLRLAQFIFLSSLLILRTTGGLV
jgi:hypothetical protein